MKRRQRKGPDVGCGKKNFTTREQAFVALRACESDHDKGQWHRRETEIYYCGKCLGWHLTSKPTLSRAVRHLSIPQRKQIHNAKEHR